MDKLSCAVARDLLPLYHDGALSEESKSLVAAHVAQCPECGALLGRMEEEPIAPRGDEISAADALRGMRRVLRRYHFRAIAIAVVAALLLTWGGIEGFQYLALVEREVGDPAEFSITDLCRTSSGVILFHAEIADGERYSSQLTQYKDGIAYVTFMRPLIVLKNNALDISGHWLELSTAMRDGKLGYSLPDADTPGKTDWVELTEIRLGTPENYRTVWQKGTEIPLADPETDRWHTYWENTPTG